MKESAASNLESPAQPTNASVRRNLGSTWGSAVAIICCASLRVAAEAVIYEPFADTNATLTGNAPGAGLSGTWLGNAAVTGGSLDYGNLPVGAGNKASINNQNGYISVGTSLSALGLLEDGANLWFSVLVSTGGDIGSNGDLGFALGTDQIGTGNNIPVANNGQALGFTFKQGQLRATYWYPGNLARSTVNTNNAAISNTTYLVVGRFIWGVSSDMIEIYKVSADMTLGAAVSTFTTATNLNQSAFDTLSFGSKSAVPAHLVDEIRFGANCADVLPVGGDTTPPLLTGIADDKGGAPVYVDTTVTYTVTFGEDMSAGSVTAEDFGNAGTATFTVGEVTETSPASGVFTVQVTPTSDGTLVLSVKQGAVLKDASFNGNALDTSSAIDDDTVIAVSYRGTTGRVL